MKTKVLLAILLIILVGIMFYFCYPKYEIYQGEGGQVSQEGIVTYRFNKITGTIQCIDYTKPKEEDSKSFPVLKWRDRKPLGFIKRP